MWVEYWIRKAHPSFEEYVLTAERYDDYRWICEINLPLIEKTVKSISQKEVNAMLNASENAAKLIDEYMKEHPELKIINRFKNKRWEILGDEDGKVLRLGMSNSWRRDIGKQIEKMSNDSITVIKKAIKKLSKINGTSKNLFIQVIDQSLFDDDKTIKEIIDEVNEKIQKEYRIVNMATTYQTDGDSVIVVGYTLPSIQKGDLN